MYIHVWQKRSCVEKPASGNHTLFIGGQRVEAVGGILHAQEETLIRRRHLLSREHVGSILQARLTLPPERLFSISNHGLDGHSERINIRRECVTKCFVNDDTPSDAGEVSSKQGFGTLHGLKQCMVQTL